MDDPKNPLFQSVDWKMRTGIFNELLSESKAMTLEEFKDEKQALENKIAQLIRDFEYQTRMNVQVIHLSRMAEMYSVLTSNTRIPIEGIFIYITVG